MEVYPTASFTIIAPPTLPTGMIGVYRYNNPVNGQHIITSDWEELGSASLNFAFEKTLGFMCPSLSSAANTKPIYRYYDISTGSHFTTDKYADFSPLAYEKILGYVGISQTTDMSKALSKWFNVSVDDHFVCVPPAVPLGSGYIQDTNPFIFGYIQ